MEVVINYNYVRNNQIEQRTERFLEVEEVKIIDGNYICVYWKIDTCGNKVLETFRKRVNEINVMLCDEGVKRI